MSNAGRVICPPGKNFAAYRTLSGTAASDFTFQVPFGTQAGGTPDNTTAGVASWTNTLGVPVMVDAVRLVIETPSAAGGTITAGKAANGGSLPSAAYAATLAVSTAGVRNFAAWSSTSVAGEVIRLLPGEAVTVSRDGGDVTALRGRMILTIVPLQAIRN